MKISEFVKKVRDIIQFANASDYRGDKEHNDNEITDKIIELAESIQLHD